MAVKQMPNNESKGHGRGMIKRKSCQNKYASARMSVLYRTVRLSCFIFHPPPMG